MQAMERYRKRLSQFTLQLNTNTENKSETINENYKSETINENYKSETINEKL